MFKKPKFNKQNKFSGISSENESENQNNDINNSNLIFSYNQNNQSNDSSKDKDLVIKTFSNTLENKLEENKNLEETLNKKELKITSNENVVNNINDNSVSKHLSDQKEAIKKMLKKNTIIVQEKNSELKNSGLPLNENENAELNQISNQLNNIDQSELLDYSNHLMKIKETIDKRSQKPKRRGTLIKPLEKVLTSFNKTEDNSDPGIKKIFISEHDLKNTTNPEELKKLMGINKEEIDREKKLKIQKILDHQKDLFTLPDDLRVTPETKNDYVDNLIKLSAAGLIEVPLSLENKLKNIEETEIMKKQIIDKRLAEELDYLKVLKKLGPSYAKGYKNDLSRKKLTKLNNVFGNVFVNLNGRKRKLLKEKMIIDNRLMEEGYIRQKGDVHSDKESICDELESDIDNNDDEKLDKSNVQELNK